MEMSELREELERQFKAIVQKDKKSEDENILKDASADVQPEVQGQIVVCIEAPKSFSPEFAEDFKNLSKEWQKYLIKREDEISQEIEKYITQLSNYKWVDEIFSRHYERLSNKGIEKFQNWLEGLALIDDAMDKNPTATLKAIATVYGVKTDISSNDDKVCEQIITRLCDLERSYNDLTSYMQQQQIQNLNEKLQMFRRQTDKDGNVLHPYFDAVFPQIMDLLQTGMIVDVAEAYEKALWLNPKVRDELISKTINTKAADAQKAKDAAFLPKGKAKEPQRELTLREEIAKNMAAFLD